MTMHDEGREVLAECLDTSGVCERLSRDLLSNGDFAAMIAKEAPALRLLTDEEQRESLRHMLSIRPAGDAWIFAYGSLIWNPAIHIVEQRRARIVGWHRSFCLSAIAGRGSPENPGLVLGLDEGGHCDGVALRLPEDSIEAELTLLWRREMVAGAYIPRWVDLVGTDGEVFGSGIAFTMDRTASVYAGGLQRAITIQRLATASGSIGSSAEYLFRTRDGLRTLGIEDDEIERLAEDVEQAQSAALPPSV
ncbi:MAG: gamma-glutamylcyclotransferase [Rhizobiaceae bacterium]|nr:gamma-glutamylcyclotransferase [Rhizobiaceae bacterium]